MNQLIKIESGEGGKQTVNARELHAFLDVGKDFSTWIKNRIEQYDFVDRQDFVTSEAIPQNGGAGNRGIRIEYAISLDMAKELAMVERNAKGKEARQYFIECERQAKTVTNPVDLLNDPAAMRGILLNYTEKVIQLEHKVEALTPKAEALDRFATYSDGSFCLRDAAKTLQVPEKRFIQLLHEKNWIYRRPLGAGWLAYSEKLQAGVMEHKITTGQKSDGSEWIGTQPRITAKGLVKLSEILSIR